MNVFLIQSEWLFTGIVVWLGFLFVFFKLSRGVRSWLVHHALITDLLVTGVMFTLHWGTLTGTMAATLAGILTAIFTSCVKPFYRKG
jgi:hypothetical protein